MYEVMRSIYESDVPISFKGSMVLKACLIEAGYNEDTRHTFDIDANWYSDTAPTAEQMTSSLQNAIDRNALDLDIKLSRLYGNGRSAGFRISDKSTGDELFTMDMDVNRPPYINNSTSINTTERNSLYLVLSLNFNYLIQHRERTSVIFKNCNDFSLIAHTMLSLFS